MAIPDDVKRQAIEAAKGIKSAAETKTLPAENAPAYNDMKGPTHRELREGMTPKPTPAPQPDMSADKS